VRFGGDVLTFDVRHLIAECPRKDFYADLRERRNCRLAPRRPAIVAATINQCISK
jgi:hypothetical protein